MKLLHVSINSTYFDVLEDSALVPADSSTNSTFISTAGVISIVGTDSILGSCISDSVTSKKNIPLKIFNKKIYAIVKYILHIKIIIEE